MTRELFCQAVLKFCSGVLLVGLLLFLPAGTLRWRRAWLLMALLFIPMFIAGLVMMRKAPELLRKRLNGREKQGEQRQVIALSGLMFLLGFGAAGLSFRYGWFVLPRAVSWVGAALFLLAYLLYAEVLRENAYLSRTVEVQPGQRVMDTGLYGIVRHPMYAATLLLFLSMPLVLGSPVAEGIFLVYPLLLAKRIRNEEEVLERELEGYTAYKGKVRYKMIPLVW